MAGEPINPAIYFEPDGYRMDGDKVMGRQAAGNGFLRAAVAARGDKAVVGYTASERSAEWFRKSVAEIDARAATRWVQPGRIEELREVGHLYMPGPTLADLARQRLPAGGTSWSLTGVTHTTASHAAMDAITGLLTEPLTPWDALICTSQAVLTTVKIVLQAQHEYLQSRLGKFNAPPLPQLPVIPLGVHCGDFVFDAQARRKARQSLGIGADDVVVLFVGRLSFHAKAHPHAMYLGLQAAARASGRKVVLVQCGWFPNEAIEEAFRSGAAAACPDVRCIYTDGRDAKARGASWGAADVFISLSDNIQETFGLTPIEAMAAGLPVVVTDWDGYKDTVRDGIDGFRIPTWQPAPGTGQVLARRHELGLDSYDRYCGAACQHVAVDHAVLAERLHALVSDAALRQRLGAAARERARTEYDWAVVYARYQSLWTELDTIRRAARARNAAPPRMAPGRLDPFIAFAHYPTHQLTPDTRVAAASGATAGSYRALAAMGLYKFIAYWLPSEELVARLLRQLAAGPATVREAAAALGVAEAELIRHAAVLAKMNIVLLEPGP